jgi:O-antigen biosynthesis protein
VTFQSNNDFLKLIQFSQSDLGAWGCTLKYPSEKVQHLFVSPGVKIVGAHPFRGVNLEKSDPWFASAWPVPAITGAAMLIKASVFKLAGGFDESLATAYQDLDLCLSLQKLNLQQWSLGYVTLVHHETATRKPLHLPIEVDLMYAKWGSNLSWSGSLSAKISRWSEQPIRKWFENEYPYRFYLRHCKRN